MKIISALFYNYGKENEAPNYVNNAREMTIEIWGNLDKYFTEIASIKDFTEQTEAEFMAKFEADCIHNESINAAKDGLHYGYQGINDDIPAIFVEIP